MFDFTQLEEVRRRRPLIHCVSNIVTANDCANLALAVGASPMMAQAPEEMGDITAAAAATVLNTGTPDEIKFEVCALCGKAAAAAESIVVGPRIRKVLSSELFVEPVGYVHWVCHCRKMVINDYCDAVRSVLSLHR